MAWIGFGDDAAVDARVQVVVRALDGNLGIDQAAQAGADGRQLGREHLGIADDGCVGFQARGLAGDVAFDVVAAHFFLALDEEPHVARQLAVRLQQALDRLDEDVRLPLVIRGAAGIDVVVADLGYERRRLPFLQRVGRLHVVVPVEQQRGFPVSAEPFAVDQRVALAFDQLGFLEPGVRKLATRKLGRAPDVVLVLGERAYAWNAQPRLQLLQKSLSVGFVVVHFCVPACSSGSNNWLRRSSGMPLFSRATSRMVLPLSYASLAKAAALS